ncbi:hypothetical protein NBRC10512_007423 [Rhodotorula toruloides]|uniref:RHTO0S12e03488g1_1 n=2 Tax=Rhodotorula toruloides TaxID=5286 RepID=A0A061BH82_RHOTO|nr:uncharacterized protein RHTO_07527 [Rhodotorula toruloides NP11]EMS23185.1 hypothetical protein RHTO_07527 [Rhodotorula toruloides NP11]CDR46347.1 RHTO0S12e03488g1_1 [Rhodotorula toruloides]
MPRVGPEHENYVPRGPYVWGFPLGDLNFQAFSSKKMFDPRWHLRKERFIAYQVAMLVCLAAECTATYSLDKYEDLQKHIESRFSPAHLYQNDLIDMEISTIVLCVAVACLFGADFFFLLQFPRRVYPKWYQTTKKVLAVIITLGIFACALGSTIVVARNSAILGHVSPSVARVAVEYYFRPPLRYKDWAVNIAWVVLLWIGWVGCVAATVVMFLAADYDAVHGTSPRAIPLLPTSSSSPSSQPPSSTSLPPNTASEKIYLPVPAPHHVSLQRVHEEGVGQAVRMEMDHETFEGRGREGSVVTPTRRAEAEQRV